MGFFWLLFSFMFLYNLNLVQWIFLFPRNLLNRLLLFKDGLIFGGKKRIRHIPDTRPTPCHLSPTGPALLPFPLLLWFQQAQHFTEARVSRALTLGLTLCCWLLYSSCLHLSGTSGCWEGPGESMEALGYPHPHTLVPLFHLAVLGL